METWFKILEMLHSPNQQRLPDRIHSMLIKADKFTPQTQDQFKEETELLGQLLVAHQDYIKLHGGFGDMFGDYLTQTNRLNKGTGQFFTPIQICDFITVITLSAKNMEKIQFFNDPVAGTGRFMLRTAKHYAEQTGKLNFVYINTDIDFNVYVYCIMNAILNKIPSLNCWGDSLAMEYREGFLVIPDFVLHWHRIEGEKIKSVFFG